VYSFMDLGSECVLHQPLVVLRPEVIALGARVRVDAFCKLEGGLGLRIGRATHVASFVHLGSGGGALTIGEECAISSGAVILSGSSDLRWPTGSAQSGEGRWSPVRAHTVLGHRVFIGAHAVIMPGVVLGDGAIIGAGAIVTHDVGAESVWVGIPARLHGPSPRAHPAFTNGGGA
jgi:acetyltransferase-like isoleucine patch superfamily enzyme